MTPAWLARLRERADTPPLRPRDTLRLAQARAEIGSVEPALAQRLADAGLLRSDGAAAWLIDDPADAALARIAAWLREAGVASRWRDELLAVTDAAGKVHAAIERAAVRPLGITTHAVHLVGRHPDGRWWLQQRALDKATDPGLWDTLMGGLVAGHETLLQTLERETWEEAGLHVAELQQLADRGQLRVRRPVAEGYMVERIWIWEAVVPAALQPVNQDGEVQRFECVDDTMLREWLVAEAFTLEAALVLVQVLPTVPPRAA